MNKMKCLQTLSVKSSQQLLLQAIYECWTTNRKWSLLFFACAVSFFSLLALVTFGDRFVYICLPLRVIVITYVCVSGLVYACTMFNVRAHISHSRAFNLLVCHFIPFGWHHIQLYVFAHSRCLSSALTTRFGSQIFNLSSPFEQPLTVRMLLFSWIVILRWRWQCFAFEYPKHNYICSWKLHACCCCHYTTIVVTAAAAVIVIIVIAFGVAAHTAFRCVFLSRNKQLLN